MRGDAPVSRRRCHGCAGQQCHADARGYATDYRVQQPEFDLLGRYALRSTTFIDRLLDSSCRIRTCILEGTSPVGARFFGMRGI